MFVTFACTCDEVSPDILLRALHPVTANDRTRSAHNRFRIFFTSNTPCSCLRYSLLPDSFLSTNHNHWFPFIMKLPSISSFQIICSLSLIYHACKTPVEKALLYTFMYSPCREGELGRHPLKDGTEYPGLRVEMMSEPFEVTDSDGNIIITCNMNVIGKKGPKTYHLDPELRNMLLSIAAPNGQVFTTKASPNGMRSNAIAQMIRELCLRAGITGDKLGPHSFRHTAASLIAKRTGSVLAVMAGIQDTEVKSAMVYIHDVEDELKHTQSVSSLVKNNLFTKPQPTQTKLIPDTLLGGQTSTAHVPYGEMPIQKVEVVPDLSEELFPEVPTEQTDRQAIHARLTTKRLLAMRKAFVYYARTAPQGGTIGELSQMFKDFFRRINARR